ncbi:ribosome small subunit-dependent GTPase A [Thermosynechococcaceae cyanobacterium BACA0444]|uniref:Small ribosomal subunit biogenesis GTPase RsgA n=1 Tax=Pseudocalidococcus azoricus BACA0444 TaxID=2918990 RepID=A0AAE4FQP7_9CYAN|nr:ribosome small subunit-dependent GTPase A [Pseudocalidococcus azoricus]MDS3859762.1 ribosome small subunit-dependent GTPase A [Pseudocalidococcus azoricus BACA0444]
MSGTPSSPPMRELTGTVMAAQANYYRVQLHAPTAPPGQLLCLRRGKLKKQGQQVLVGDQVIVSEPDWQSQRGMIDQVLPRHCALARPAIANVNQILLVFALHDPEPEPWQVSRFLVTAAASGLEITVVLSKADLVGPEMHQAWVSRLDQWGYRGILLSIRTGLGLVGIQALLNHKITVICGPSGVGKSSLIKQLIPEQEIRIGTVSEHWHKGKHTTRHIELFPLPTGGLLADTPGFNQPHLEFSPSALAACFPEIQTRLQTQACQFHNCQHLAEPDCVVRGAWERYPHYQLFHQELTAAQDAAATMPHLATKHTQRLSQLPRKAQRRQSHQTTQGLWLDDADR